MGRAAREKRQRKINKLHNVESKAMTPDKTVAKSKSAEVIARCKELFGAGKTVLQTEAALKAEFGESPGGHMLLQLQGMFGPEPVAQEGKELTPLHSTDLTRLAYGHLSHDQMASKVRMLMRDTLNHEAVVSAARDRIKWLAWRVEQLEAALASTDLRKISNETWIRNSFEDRLPAIAHQELLDHLMAPHLEERAPRAWVEAWNYKHDLHLRGEDLQHIEMRLHMDKTLCGGYDADVQTAIHMFACGVPPKFSTGLCESTTAGYGNLDANGYWQFPLPDAFINWMNATAEAKRTLEDTHGSNYVEKAA